jgi:hypothetical protein
MDLGEFPGIQGIPLIFLGLLLGCFPKVPSVYPLPGSAQSLLGLQGKVLAFRVKSDQAFQDFQQKVHVKLPILDRLRRISLNS